MRILPSPLAGAWRVEWQTTTDERGSFSRRFDQEAFRGAGLTETWAMEAVARNLAAFTMRGLHFQRHPHSEAKLVTCARGRLYDVVADVRPDSPQFGQWTSFELTEDADFSVYVAPGMAHGYLTLSAATEVEYLLSEPYHAPSASGVRWDSLRLAIDWPAPPQVISERDASLPEL